MEEISNYNRDAIIEASSYNKVLCAENLGHYLIHPDAFIVYEWDLAPIYFKKICTFAGGDEDWLVVSKNLPDPIPFWMEKLGTDISIYNLNGITIIVGAH